MQASVIVREGKRQFTVELRKSETVIGRDPAADIIVNDTATSRRHAMIVAADEGRYVIRDLESRNGTLVNGAKVKEKELFWGDRIVVGPMQLVFVTKDDEDGVDKKNPGRPKTGVFKAKTMGVNVNDLDLTFVKKPRPHHVNSFYQIAAVLPLYRDTERASEALLDILLSNFKASRAAALFFGEGDKLIERVIPRVAQEEYGINIDFREDILKLVHSTGRAFFQDEDVSSLYAPIPHEGKAIGALYLDTVQQSTRLTEDDLWVLSGIAVQYAVILQDLRYREKLEREKVALEESAAAEEVVVGESAPMKEVLKKISEAAGSDAVVVLTGENGTGKELIARTIHHASRRRAGPFIAVNCGGLAPDEMENVLFGHEKGAVEGVEAARKGAFERANGGTLFLDEVGELDLLLQLKLLKVFEDRTIRRRGGETDLPVDIRTILASTRSIPDLVAGKTFRDDLYQKLQGVEVHIPALRERPEDIQLLAQHFVKKFGAKIGRRLDGIEPDALQILSQHTWPGNVRELQNLIEHAVILTTGPKIRVADLRAFC
jgi:transcriptional regulator with GAF, ATPase, and Fis domain